MKNPPVPLRHHLTSHTENFSKQLETSMTGKLGFMTSRKNWRQHWVLCAANASPAARSRKSAEQLSMFPTSSLRGTFIRCWTTHRTQAGEGGAFQNDSAFWAE